MTFDHHIAHQDFIRLVAIENIHRGEFIGRLDSLRTLVAAGDLAARRDPRRAAASRAFSATTSTRSTCTS